MPFDLRIHYLPLDGRPAWSMEAPSWLDHAPLPFDRGKIREIHSGYYRDRYVPISAAELREWHERHFPSSYTSGKPMPPEVKQQLDQFENQLGKGPEGTMYVLHWEEWESGL